VFNDWFHGIGSAPAVCVLLFHATRVDTATPGISVPLIRRFFRPQCAQVPSDRAKSPAVAMSVADVSI
jgi:hypothetical protein